MPSRHKTRKQPKQNGGAGIFSLFSKPSPQLPYESYLSSINRVYLFLYSKVKPTTSGYIPIEKDQIILTQEQKDYFRSLLEPYTTSDNEEEFVKKILGTDSIQILNREIQQVEAPNTQVLDLILNRPAIAQSFAGSWGRFIPVIFSSEKQITYRQNWEQNICKLDQAVDQNVPIRSLEENRCIIIYHRKLDLSIIEGQFQLVYGNKTTIGPGVPILFVEKEYMPEMNGVPFPYTMIRASELMNTSFILDAFINNGVKEIQPNLAAVLQKEKKQLWNQYSLVKVIDYRDLATHDVFGEKFISVSDEFSAPKDTYFLLPNLSSMDEVKGMDAQSTLQMRVRYPTIWATLGADPNVDFFLRLPYKQQIRFSILQSQQYIKLAQTNPETAFRTAHLTDLRDPTKKEEFLRNIDADLVETYRKILERHR